jgi:hypothetical protein
MILIRAVLLASGLVLTIYGGPAVAQSSAAGSPPYADPHDFPNEDPRDVRPYVGAATNGQCLPLYAGSRLLEQKGGSCLWAVPQSPPLTGYVLVSKTDLPNVSRNNQVNCVGDPWDDKKLVCELTPFPSSVQGDQATGTGPGVLHGGVQAVSLECEWDRWSRRIANAISKGWQSIEAGSVPLKAEFTYEVLAPGRWKNQTGQQFTTTRYQIRITSWTASAVPYGYYQYRGDPVNSGVIRQLQLQFKQAAQTAVEKLNNSPALLTFPSDAGPVPMKVKKASFSNQGGKAVTYGDKVCDD